MTTCSVVGTPARFARCLANFQVDELLLLKKSVQRMEELTQEEACLPEGELPESKMGLELPERMALMAADRGHDHDSSGPSHPWHSSHPGHPTWPEPKPSKLQTLFQVSITALAFLSFGGYLLCLIVQAIKSKGTTYFHPQPTAAAASTLGNVKRIKVYRRSRRSKGNPGDLLLQDYASYMNNVRRTHLVGS